MRECKAAIDEPMEDDRQTLRGDPDRKGAESTNHEGRHGYQGRRTFHDRLTEASRMRGGDDE